MMAFSPRTPSTRRAALLMIVAALAATSACKIAPTPGTPTDQPTPGTGVPASTTSAPTTTAGTGPSTTAGSPSTPTVAPAAGVRQFDWNNTTYPSDSCGTDIVPAGSRTEDYIVRDGDTGVTDLHPIPELSVSSPTFGDLTGDGSDEAVVHFRCETGGTLKWSTAWLYTSDAASPGGIRRLAQVDPLKDVLNPDGTRAIDGRNLDTVTIASGRLTTTWTVYADTDPNCCPSQLATVHQRWNGSALVNDGSPTVSGREGS
jgi:hypothetical protein